MITGKFKKYIPDDEKLLNDAGVIKKNTGLDVIFLCDNDGNDWYEMQSGFEPNTIKLMFDDNGIVRSYSADVSSLNPIDSFVAEIALDDLPTNIDILGGWRFDGEKVIPVETDPVAENESKKQKLITEATAIIAPLQDAVELSIATDRELEGLLEWKTYRVLLTRVDPQNPIWPKKPV